MVRHVTISASVSFGVNFRPRIQKSLCKVTKFQSAHRVDLPLIKTSSSFMERSFVVLVDFYSDFIEVKDLHKNTSTAVIEFLKVQFSRYGIPDTLATDNGPQLSS